jgi:hypothetical protein
MDTKSAGLLGLCLIIAAFIVAFVPRGVFTPVLPDVGRYQFERSNGANCFVLDTRTGRLWQGLVSANSNEPPTWSESKGPWLSEGGGK